MQWKESLFWRGDAMRLKDTVLDQQRRLDRSMLNTSKSQSLKRDIAGVQDQLQKALCVTKNDEKSLRRDLRASVEEKVQMQKAQKALETAGGSLRRELRKPIDEKDQMQKALGVTKKGGESLHRELRAPVEEQVQVQKALEAAGESLRRQLRKPVDEKGQMRRRWLSPRTAKSRSAVGCARPSTRRSRW